jgi:hypothetical protein
VSIFCISPSFKINTSYQLAPATGVHRADIYPGHWEVLSVITGEPKIVNAGEIFSLLSVFLTSRNKPVIVLITGGVQLYCFAEGSMFVAMVCHVVPLSGEKNKSYAD